MNDEAGCGLLVEYDNPDSMAVAIKCFLEEPDFLWLYDQEELIRELGWEFGDGEDQVLWLDVREIRLLDGEGNDITDHYRDDSVTESWGGGIGTAEQFLLYVYMGIVALLGLVMVRYFLRKD